MFRRFAGKHVIVTGAGRGIGQAIAERFAAEAADVLLVGRTLGPLEKVVDGIVANGGHAWAHPGDVARSADVAAVVDAAMARWGRVDVLVNNAGIDDDTPFLEVDEARWREVIDVNLTGPFLVSQQVAREMAAVGGGVILHIASIDAFGGDGPYAAYNASKAALLGLNRTMALELGRHDIRVNCVSPGFTHTQMTEAAVGPQLLDYLSNRFARVPLSRLVRTDEVAAACAYLASEDASAITGTNLTVDCGLTANWYILETLPGQ